MGICQRINSMLNYELKIDLDRTVSWNRALALLGLMVIALSVSGYYIGDRWFWAKNRTYYEYRIENLRDLQKKQPKSNGIGVELAMAHYLNGEISKAISMLNDVLLKEPENSTATLYLGLMLSEQKQFKQSVGMLTKYIQTNQGLETRIAYFYLGQNYLALDKNELALKYLKYAAVRDPGNPAIYYFIGQTYEKMGDNNNAIISYKKALVITRNYPLADTALKSLLTRQN